jgi:hypothetical protein
MASPAVASYGTYASSAAASNHTGNYPATVNAGDLLIAIVGAVGSGRTATITDWTNIVNHSHSINPSGSVLYKWANGTEGGGTFTLALSASVSAVCRVFRITGAENPSTQAPQMAAADVDQNTTNAPSPPDSASGTGGSKDYLGIAYTIFGGTTGTLGGGDTDRQTLVSSFDGGEVAQATSYSAFTGTSYNPSDYSNSTSRNTTSHTILVHPAAAVGGGGSVVPTLAQRNRRHSGRYM